MMIRIKIFKYFIIFLNNFNLFNNIYNNYKIKIILIRKNLIKKTT